MSLYSKLRGTIEGYFQLGLGSAQLKGASSNVIEARDASDSAYAIVRVATPVGNDDAVTKAYAIPATALLSVDGSFVYVDDGVFLEKS